MAVSLWADTLPDELRGSFGAPLEGDVEADVAIVGAGYSGLWTAYWLQRAGGLRIALIEAEHAGFGASGRNGGWASALFPASLTQLAAVSSREAAVRMKRAMHQAVADLGATAANEGWPIDWQAGGTLGAARTPLQLQRAQAEIAEWRDWGFGPEDYRMLDADEAATRIRTTDLLGATFTPHCAAIHPAKLVSALARTVVARGAQLFEHTTATAIEPGIVRTHRGTVRAPIIVRATEAYTRTLAGHRRTLAPVYSLMVATEPLTPDTWAQIGLAERETFHDGRNLIIYGQRTADGRLAFGGRGAPYHFGSRISPAQDVDGRVHDGLIRVLHDLFPALAGTHITHRWGGPLGIPRDWWASCGFNPRTGLAWTGGYVGDGVVTSFLGGRTLADLIGGAVTERVDLPWVGHRSPPWEPEPLRWLGANAGLRVMQRADAHEARTGRPSRIARAFGRRIGH